VVNPFPLEKLSMMMFCTFAARARAFVGYRLNPHAMPIIRSESGKNLIAKRLPITFGVGEKNQA
jgi:hypothetical protein